jgi:hypothetical protein
MPAVPSRILYLAYCRVKTVVACNSVRKFEWKRPLKDVGVRVAQKPVNLKYSPVLTGMFEFKPSSQFVGGHHSIVSYVLNKENFEQLL